MKLAFDLTKSLNWDTLSKIEVKRLYLKENAFEKTTSVPKRKKFNMKITQLLKRLLYIKEKLLKKTSVHKRKNFRKREKVQN